MSSGTAATPTRMPRCVDVAWLRHADGHRAGLGGHCRRAASVRRWIGGFGTKPGCFCSSSCWGSQPASSSPEGLRADAEGVHGQDRRPHRPKCPGRRGLTGDLQWQHRNMGTEAGGMPDPIHQFEIQHHHPDQALRLGRFVHQLLALHAGGSSLLIAGFFMLSMRAARAGAGRAAVGGRDQPRVRRRHAARQHRAGAA